MLDNVLMHANGSNAINITGTVTDKYNLDGSASEGGKPLTVRGSGYNFTGTVDVTRVALVGGANVSFASLNTSELVIGNNVSLTFGALDMGQALTLSGDILSGLNAVGDSVNLFTVNTLTGWNPDEAGQMLATEWLTFGDEKFTNIDAVLTYTDNVVALTVVNVIPEPATATLSLLALAGLAARRRRR